MTTFTDFKTEFLPIIDASLDEALSLPLKDDRDELCQAMRHSLLNGGKRIRPLLSLASHALFSKHYASILPLCSAIEMVHTYSLIHDDLPAMDNDDFRRGKPTCHKQFGDAMAILAGDNLHTLAFELLSTQLSSFKSAQVLRAIQSFSSLIGMDGLIGGQVLDIKSDTTHQDLAHLKQIHEKKTGALIQFSVMAPAILEDQSEDIIQSLKQFGYHLGLLFQITDDILDVTGDVASLGKSPNKDQDMNKLTYVNLLGLDQAKKEAQLESEKSQACLASLSTMETDLLSDIISVELHRTS